MNKEEKNKLAEENLGLVYLVVNKEFTYEKTTESDRENYIEEGMIGLAKAINTFNPSKGAYSSLVNRDEILNILGKMKIKNIKYITLKRAEGYTYEKIGNKIGVSKETIRARLNKAKKELIELGITA